ncbi:Gfo/Idh/MocA family protein [Labedella endophytica]|uniref:Gfo/Idh/MocA family oxidoreductase n=1 Tax=Labedella endophytica TaxID=1523160 RepID=A0A433JQU8_9MICO|nr:Gfo/Idh/MocA family oxidoreductase [Labedella endophytica]RUQ99056.1 Gfo/Idh/MocA family oxidoreductase [Labedella endophytica]
MPERTRVGVGLVSVGWMGRVHARAYRAVGMHYPDVTASVSLVSAADVNADARQYAADALGFATTTDDWRKVIDDPEVDVVSICTPNYLHHEVALAAASAGKPFWIEKPMGRGAAESADIARAATAAGIVTSVGFNYRHAPAVARIRELVRGGHLGRITNVRVALLADYSADPRGALTWRFRTEEAGSGVLGDLLSHGADLAQFTVGRISEVTALTERFIRERPLPSNASSGHFSLGSASAETGEVENEDYAALLVRFDSGAVGVMDSSRVAVGPHAEYTLEIYGTLGSVRWDFQRFNELQIADSADGYRTVMAGPEAGDFSRFQPGRGTSMGFDDLKTIEAQLFLRSVVEGRQVGPSASDAWSASEIVAAALRSDERRAWESVPTVEGATTFDS